MKDMKDNSIFDIVNTSIDIQKHLLETGGELTPELEQKLSVSASELASKTDNYGAILVGLNESLKLWKERQEYVDSMVKKHETLIEKLESNLMYAMKSLGVDRIEGDTSAFKIRKSGGSVNIDNESLIPEEFKKNTVVTTIDKKKILTLLREGIPVEGASLKINESIATSLPNIIK